MLRPVKQKIGSTRNQVVGLGSSTRKRILQRIYNPKGETKATFLVGCGRSGTSMIVFHLDRSWQIDLYNENNPQAFRNFRLRGPAQVDALVEQSFARVALFKPILSTQQSRHLLSRFPDSKVIFAYRHFYDVINSSILRFGPASWLDRVNKWGVNDFSEFGEIQPPEPTKEWLFSLWRENLSPADGIAIYWLFYNQLYFDLQLNKHKRAMLVKYESIAKEPRLEFTRVSKFMEIEFEPAFVEGVYLSSVKKGAPADLSPGIKEECDNLWERLNSIEN
jgi:hypothetical protein